MQINDKKGVWFMKKMSKCLIFVFLFCLVYVIAGFTGVARAEDEKKLFFLSPTISWYLPTDSKTKDAFGNTWSGFGVTVNLDALGLTPNLSMGDLKLYPYFGYFHGDKGNNDAYIIPVGIDARWGLMNEGVVKVYTGVGVAGYGVKFEDKDAGVDSGWRGAFGGRVMLGMDITKWFNIQAAYNVMTEVKGYDFNGVSIQGTIRLYF